CRPTADANPEGDSDAHSGFGDFGNRSRLGSGTGAGTDLRSRLSGLPACLWQGQLLRMHLYLPASMQHVGVGPLGAMRDQSLFRTCISRPVGTPLQAIPQRLLSVVYLFDLRITAAISPPVPAIAVFHRWRSVRQSPPG